MEKFRTTFAEIDLGALRENLLILQNMRAARKFFCPMVKANAYGHGAIEVSRCLVGAGVRSLGVALVEEGVELRLAGVTSPDIFVFGFFNHESIQACLRHRLTPVLSRMADLKLITKQSRSVPVHLKFNTGMNRLGFDLKDQDSLQAELQAHPQIQLAGLCTHLLNGEDLSLSDGYTRRQIEMFRSLKANFPASNIIWHALNSSALISSELHDGDYVYEFGARPGIALYGSSPRVLDQRGSGQTLDSLKPVMSLHSQVGEVREVLTGEVVSYSGVWRAKRKSRIAVVPVGYGDGIHRCLTGTGKVLIRGERVPMVGTICMDYILIDVTEIERGRPVIEGEQVTIFGQQGGNFISAEEVAHGAGTISYEILTSVSARVPRYYTKNG